MTVKTGFGGGRINFLGREFQTEGLAMQNALTEPRPLYSVVDAIGGAKMVLRHTTADCRHGLADAHQTEYNNV